MTGRSLLLTRVIKASPERVWQCWTDPDLLPKWFGPKGFSCKTHEIDLRQGGHWLFDMIGPQGEIYPNLHRYLVYVQNQRIEFNMYDPNVEAIHAEVLVTLTPTDGGTRIAQEMTFADRAMRDAVVNFGAVEMGQTTYDKLAELAES